MKLTQFKIVPFILAVSALLILSGCDGTTGVSSDGGLTGGTIISALIGDGSTSYSNTSRNVAIDSSGNIYVAYHGTNGIYASVSKDSGTTFSTPIQVSTLNLESSIAVSSNGTVFVAWVEGSAVKVSRSLDKGITYDSPSTIGTGTNSIHMDTDGSNIYIISWAGREVLYSNDNGENFSGTAIIGGAFSDIWVDKTNHYVYLQTEAGHVDYSVSTDFGETFSSAVPAVGEIPYSTAAISSSINGRYLFVSGVDTQALRIDLDTNTSTPLTFGNNTTSKGRSLAADSLGNVVDGYYYSDINGSSVYFAVSHNLGDTFSDAIKVDENSTNISVGIDSVNNKVVVAYEKDDQVYVKTYVDMLLQ